MPRSAPVRESGSYRDARGVTIYYCVWRSARPKGVVQVLHGLGDHAARYEKLAHDLVRAGYSVYADDHRGHGRTGAATRMGHLGSGGMRATVDAIRQFTALVRSENPGIPLIAIGHSWGSLMLQILINTNAADYDAAVLTGTAYRTLFDMNGGDLNKRHKHLGNTGNEWLSRDISVHAAFSDDPLTFSARATKQFGLIGGLRLLGRPGRQLSRDLPVLIMIGSEDSLGGEKSVAKLARDYTTRSRLSDVRTIVYPGARHEVFNETNRDEVVADLIEWLDSHLVP